MSKIKCVRVEWDPNYNGGDYSSVGQFAYVPWEVIDRIKAMHMLLHDERAVEIAFAARVGDPRHIVHFTLDEVYDQDGNPWPEEGEQA